MDSIVNSNKFKFSSLFLSVLLLASVTATTIHIEPVFGATNIKHSRVKTVRVGLRITLAAEVKDDAGVDVVRAYFRSSDSQNFNFVRMTSNDGWYHGVLPAAAADTQKIIYLLLVKNTANKVVISQKFTIKVKKARGVITKPADKVQVYSELATPPDTVDGFSDNIAVDGVESALKFGVVAGIIDAGAAATTVGAASGTTAVSGGTVAVASGSVSALAVVGVVVVGAGAAASGGGSGDSSGGNSSSSSGSSNNSNTTLSVGGLTVNCSSPSQTTFHYIEDSSGTARIVNGGHPKAFSIVSGRVADEIQIRVNGNLGNFRQIFQFCEETPAEDFISSPFPLLRIEGTSGNEWEAAFTISRNATSLTLSTITITPL